MEIIMTHDLNSNLLSTVMEVLIKDGAGGAQEVLQTLMNAAMKVERENYLKAKPYERTEDREDYANGFKPKALNTRTGRIDLQIPQVRSSGFYPACLEKGCRSERALMASMAEMYVQGVSTRKVTKILTELCGLEVSSTQISNVTASLDKGISEWKHQALGSIAYLYLDAHYQKVREGGRVVSLAVLMAIGVDSVTGMRSVLGISVSLSEAEVHWRNFLTSLQKRGMHGVKLIVSDDHAGLKAALKNALPSVQWQRCQFHLQKNAQSYIPKQEMKKGVAATIRSIFQAPDVHEAKRLLQIGINKYEKTAPRLSAWMEENIEEGLSHFSFPESHWKKIRTNNMPERTHKEIRRRTKVVGIFPNESSCERLIASIVMEISEGWEYGKAYLKME
jgi:putative transposase